MDLDKLPKVVAVVPTEGGYFAPFPQDRPRRFERIASIFFEDDIIWDAFAGWSHEEGATAKALRCVKEHSVFEEESPEYLAKLLTHTASPAY